LVSFPGTSILSVQQESFVFIPSGPPISTNELERESIIIRANEARKELEESLAAVAEINNIGIGRKELEEDLTAVAVIGDIGIVQEGEKLN
jgi:hypothetical protein